MITVGELDVEVVDVVAVEAVEVGVGDEEVVSVV